MAQLRRTHDLDAGLHARPNDVFLSALVAAIPIVVLLGTLALFHVKAHSAAIMGLAATVQGCVAGYSIGPCEIGLTLHVPPPSIGYLVDRRSTKSRASPPPAG